MKVKLKWIYKGKKTDQIELESEWTTQESLEKLIPDIENTGRAKEIVIIDEMGNEWTKKEFTKLKEAIEQEPHDMKVYFDGGYDRKSGNAGLGVVIFYKKGKKSYRLRTNHFIEMMETNNEAEYAALFYAITQLQELGVHHLPCTFRGDAQGVLRQLLEEWPCYDEKLNAWLDRIEGKLHEMGVKPSYEVINRNDNKEADWLAGQALKRVTIHSTKEI